MQMTELRQPASPEKTLVLDDRLKGRAMNVNSQFGEDGLIDAALSIIGETNRFCFEAGASDGRTFSNVRRLIVLGWQAILIESDAIRFDDLLDLQSSRVEVVLREIDHMNINQVLSLNGCPQTPDLGVLDIDGQEWHVWNAMKFRPRLMLVEFQPRTRGPYVPPAGLTGYRPNEQATFESIVSLGEAKGYRLLAATYVNALFVSREAWDA